MSRYELPRDPGDTFEYSNVAIGLLGHALSRRAGTTYEALVSDRILRRLGMTHTAVTFTPWMEGHLVQGHNRAGKPVANWDFPALPGMGALRSSHERHVDVCCGQPVTERHRPDLVDAQFASWTATDRRGCRIPRDTFCIQASAGWIQLVHLATRRAPDRVDCRPNRGVFNVSGAGSRGTARSGRADEHRPQQRRLRRFPSARPHCAAVSGPTGRSCSIKSRAPLHGLIPDLPSSIEQPLRLV